MKKIKFICSILFLAVVASGCTKIEGIDQDLSFLSTVGFTNPSKVFDISNDNSGNVKITPLGNGATSYTVNFGHGTGAAASAVVAPGFSATHSYPEGTYTVSIAATDNAGVSTTNTFPLTVTYRAPENLKVKIESNMVVSAEALNAKSFEVSYGDTVGKVYPLALGAKLPAHTYPAGGPYELKVVALSGGAAKTTFVKTLSGLPLTFDNSTVKDSIAISGTGQAFAKVANPFSTGLNTSSMVGTFTRGKEGNSSVKFIFDVPVNFAQGNQIKLWVYNTDAAYIGKKMNVEFESVIGFLPPTALTIAKATVLKSGEWEELTFDFSPNTASAAKFQTIVFRFSTLQVIPGAIIYFDNVRLTN